jgi:hypothetical protein
MNHNIDEDLQLDALMKTWSVSDCDPAFASRIVARALNEPSAALPKGRRRLLVPLLLAACLFSAGAFAAWETITARVHHDLLRSSVDDPGRVPARAPQVSFNVMTATAHAEPEQAATTPGYVPRRAASPKAPQEQEDQSPAPERPKKVHLPRCECGISAIVCACSD